MAKELLTMTPSGLYCEAGDLFIDPWGPAERAVITHGHSDHARWGMGSYLCAAPGLEVLRIRLGTDANIASLEYGEELSMGSARVSFHPAGHVLGSAQVRIEAGDQVWVVSGDYKTEADRTCLPFQPLKCHGFVTESTFALPIYQWQPEHLLFDEINGWWARNAAVGKCSVLFAYTLGKAQRVLSGLDPAIGDIVLHGALIALTGAYRRAGVKLPATTRVADFPAKKDFAGSFVLAPPSAAGTLWLRRFGEVSTAMASGWMAIRGARRRRAIDRGFVLSDHADWNGLLSAIEATGAEKVWVTHGYAEILSRYLCERGIDASALPSRFEGEGLEDDGEAAEAAE